MEGPTQKVGHTREGLDELRNQSSAGELREAIHSLFPWSEHFLSTCSALEAVLGPEGPTSRSKMNKVPLPLELTMLKG